MNIGQRVLINAPQGSQFNDETGTVVRLLDGDSFAVQIDDRPLVPPLMFGPGEVIPVLPVDDTTEGEPMGGWEPRS